MRIVIMAAAFFLVSFSSNLYAAKCECPQGTGELECKILKESCEAYTDDICNPDEPCDSLVCLAKKRACKLGIKQAEKLYTLIKKIDRDGKTTRTCKANYLVKSTEGLALFGKFQAERGCGAFVPNRCRRRARDAITACMESHAKFVRGKGPIECVSEGVQGYPEFNLLKEIERQVCSGVESGKSIDINLTGYIFGGPGCGPRERKSKTVELLEKGIKC